MGGCPLVVLFDQDGPREAQQGFGVGEHADDIGAPLDLLVHTLD
jgi:hypothetical protein